MYSNKELSKKLKKNIPQASFLDTLKIAYRPYICTFSQLLALISENKRVYDIGCGSGMFLMLVAEYCKPAQLGGVEISQTLISNAKVLLSPYNIPIQAEVYDGLNLPHAIADYDFIFLIDVFHHIPSQNQKIFIQNLYRQMTPGSTFVFKDIDASKKFLAKMNKLHDLILSGETGNEITFNEALLMLKETGFSIISTEYKRVLWYPHYQIVCRK